MKSVTGVLLVMCAVFLAGCGGLTTVKMYDGDELQPSAQGVMSSVGVYPERNMKLNVVSIDGKELDLTRTAEFLLKPGTYTVKLVIDKDFSYSIVNKDRSYSKGVVLLSSSVKRAYIQVPLTVVAGHTYIPNAVVENDVVKAYFDDAGVGFKRECMPLRRFAIAYGGSADGKKSGC